MCSTPILEEEAMSAIQLSKDLKDIAKRLDAMIEQSAGQRVAFTLMVYTDGRASYLSTASREDGIREMKKLIELWEAGMPDIPAHKISG
jgi:predicted transcriptional regulator